MVPTIDIAALVQLLFKPRLLCICGHFRLRDIDDLFYGYKCICGGWMSEQRLRNSNVIDGAK